MEPQTERRLMTINGKEITVEQLVSEEEINWNVSCNDPLMVEDIRTVQRSSGYDPRDYGMGRMKFTDKGASWYCLTVPMV